MLWEPIYSLVNQTLSLEGVLNSHHQENKIPYCIEVQTLKQAILFIYLKI